MARITDLKVIRRFLGYLRRKDGVEGDGCWEFSGCKTRKGYGRFHVSGQTRWAHRVSFAIFAGEIPDEMVVDHICFNPACCRPDHLQLLTYGENVKRKQTREPGEDDIPI